MTSAFPRRPLSPARCFKLSLVSRASLPLLFLALAFFSFTPIEFAEASPSPQVFFLVDISGSMRGGPLKARKEWTKKWLNDHTNTSVTLISFDTTAKWAGTFDLGNADQKGKALRWATSLTTSTEQQTYLWDCCENTLTTLSNIAQQHPDAPLILHVLTDGKDTKGQSDLKRVLQLFPNAEEEPPPAGLARSGDFTIKVQSAAPPFPSPSPTATAAPTPGSSPTPLISPTAPVARTPQPTPSAMPSPTVTMAPSPTPSPTPTVVVSPSPAPTVISSPPASQSPSAGTIVFEVQDPRVIADGDFLHFVSKALPPTNTYVWTVRRNKSQREATSSGPEEEITLSGKFPVHQFYNPDSYPRSYTVQLSAKFGEDLIDAAPINVVVLGRPTIGDRLLGIAKKITLPGLLSLLTFFLGLTRKTPEQLKNESRSVAEIKKSKRWTVIWYSLAAAFALMCAVLVYPVFFGTEQPVGKIADLPAPISDASPPPGPQPVKPLTPPETAPRQAPAFITPFVLALVVLGLLGAAIRLAILARKRGHFRNLLGGISASTRDLRARSLIEQLDEIERFSQADIIPRNRLRAFKNALFEQLIKLYKIPPKSLRADVLPRLPGTLRNLINTLIIQTEKGALHWTAKLDKEEEPTGPRFNLQLDPTASSDNVNTSHSRIEIQPTDIGPRLTVFNKDDAVIQTIDRNAFRIPAYTEFQINILHEVAKDSALKITETLSDIFDTLERRLGRPSP